METIKLDLFNEQQKRELDKADSDLYERIADPELQWWMMERIRVASENGLSIDSEIKKTKSQEEAYTLVYNYLK